MAWLCDVCGQPIHLIKNKNGKNQVMRCPLESYKTVKVFFSPEFKQIIGKVLYNEDALQNTPTGLAAFKKIVPEKTPLMDHFKFVTSFNKENNETRESVFTRTLLIDATIESFFLHYVRVLIELFDKNRIYYADAIQQLDKGQFSYLWLTPTYLRECYFHEGLKESRFKSMSDLGIPSLVIYPIGTVLSIKHGSWGDILLDLITSREAMGKPTWILNTKGLLNCPEVVSSSELKSILSDRGAIPRVILDEDIEGLNKTSFSDSYEGNLSSRYI